METITAIYEHGILRPLQPLNLTENEQVRLQIEHIPAASDTSAQDRVARAALLAFAGSIHSGDAHSADNERIDADLTNEYAARQEPDDAA